MPELDIHASAREVADLFNCNRSADAVERLQALRLGQSLVVQEALDRFVAVEAREQLAALAGPGAAAEGVRTSVERLRSATGAPRFPDQAETDNLSQAQLHDVYGSIVASRGNRAARDSLDTNGERVILGLRNDTNTMARAGFGAYDDRIVVVWKDGQGARHAREFLQANTEPGAQYDHHAGSDGTRRFKEERNIVPRMDRSPGYEGVQRRNVEGMDANRDGIRDLGRISEGTTEMQRATHPTYLNSRVTGSEFALRPTAAAVAAGAGRVQRDTNADGWFTTADLNGIQDLNNTYKMHRGGSRNPDSAGCQTIPGTSYDEFIAEVTRNARQDRWQYILTSVEPGRQPQHERNFQLEVQPAPRRERGAPQADGQPQDDPDNPAHPAHPDHQLHRQIRERVGALGPAFDEHGEQLSMSLLAEAKSQGLSRVDHLFPNQATATLKSGEHLFLVQGAPGDPAAPRAMVPADVATRTPLEESMFRIEQLNRSSSIALPEPERRVSQDLSGIRLRHT